MLLKTQVLRDVALCRLANSYRRFAVSYCHHIYAHFATQKNNILSPQQACQLQHRKPTPASMSLRAAPPIQLQKSALEGVKFGAWTISEQSEQLETHMVIHINWLLHTLGGWSRNERLQKYARYTNSTAHWRTGSQHRPKDNLAYKSLENAKVIQMNLDANESTT